MKPLVSIFLLFAAMAPGQNEGFLPHSDGGQVRAVILPGPPGPQEEIPADKVLQSGHTGRVTSTLFSPDGRLLATASEDGTVCLWDVRSGIQVERLEGNGDAVRSVAFSLDGRMLAAGSDDGSIRIWIRGDGEANRSKVLQTLSGHLEPVIGLAFNAAGTRLISAGGAGDRGMGSVRLWDVKSGGARRVLDRALFGITSVFFTPDGRQALVTTEYGDMERNGSLRQYDAETGELLGESGQVIMAHSPDGRWLAVHGKTGIRIQETESGSAALLLPADALSIAFSQSGDFVAYSHEAGSAAIVRRTRGGGEAGAIRSEAWQFESLTLSPDGSLVAAGGRIWKVADGEALYSLTRTFNGPPVFTADGKRLVSASSAGNPGMRTIRCWNPETGREEVPGLGETEHAICLDLSRDGRYLATGARKVRVWDRLANRLVREFPAGRDVVAAVAFSPDGRLLAASGRGETTVWEMATGNPVLRLGSYNLLQIGAAAFSPDGRLLAASTGSGELILYDLASGSERHRLPVPGMASRLAFSPDGRYLAAGSRSALRITGGEPGGRPRFEEVPGQSAAIVCWDVATGKELYRIGAGPSVSALAFSRDGRYLISAAGDILEAGSVKMWDAASGGAVRTLVERVDVKSGYAAFSPDRRWLASGTDGGIKLWRIP